MAKRKAGETAKLKWGCRKVWPAENWTPTAGCNLSQGKLGWRRGCGRGTQTLNHPFPKGGLDRPTQYYHRRQLTHTVLRSSEGPVIGCGFQYCKCHSEAVNQLCKAAKISSCICAKLLWSIDIQLLILSQSTKVYVLSSFSCPPDKYMKRLRRIFKNCLYKFLDIHWYPKIYAAWLQKNAQNKKRMGWDWVQPLMSSMVIPSSWASRAIWCHSLWSQDLAPQAPPAQKIRKLGSQLCGRLCIHVWDSNRELASPLKSIEYLEDCRWWKTRSRMENVNNSESSS